MSYIFNTNLWRKKNKAFSQILRVVFPLEFPKKISHKTTISDDLIVFLVTVSSNQSIIINEKFS